MVIEPELGYAYIWKYKARSDSLGEFERVYGPEGPWGELFRRHPGYIRTELHRDLEKLDWYLTVDHWLSKDAYDSFRREFKSEFEDLDRQCEKLTEEEIYLGELSRIR